jgi:rod shape-determining protein MreD
MLPDIIKWPLIFIAALVLQTSFVPVIAIGGVRPDLLVIALFFFSVKYGVIPGMFAGFFLGLGQDLYSPSLLGQNALAKTVIGAFVGMFNVRMMRTDSMIKTLLLLVTFLINDMLFYIIQIVKLHESVGVLFMGLLTKTFPRTLYSIVIAAFFFMWDMIPKPALRR